MNSNEIALLNLIKKSLFNADITFLEDTDWEEVHKEASLQMVMALTAGAVPESEAAKWLEPAAQSTSHYLKMLFEQKNLVSLFTANDIPFVIIKGMAAAVYYPNPLLRTMGDIDFIVPEEYYDASVELLTENDYVLDETHDTERHCGFLKGGIDVELHRRYSHEIDVEPIIISGIQRRVTRKLNGYDFPTLPDFENGFIILEHIHHHIHSALGLRQIIDWTMFASQVLSDENYYEHFLPLVESVGLVTFCETITKMCKMYLGLPDSITWCDRADADTATEIMQIIMKKGNFGLKEHYIGKKPMELLSFDIKRRGLFKSLQEIGLNNFEICRKNRFWRPFAWLFQLFRFAGQGIAALLRGENLIKDINSGNRKADLYEKLDL